VKCKKKKSASERSILDFSQMKKIGKVVCPFYFFGSGDPTQDLQ
jgi:hypothetical protein